MKDILSEIIAHKQTEIELQKQTVSLEQLQEQACLHGLRMVEKLPRSRTILKC